MKKLLALVTALTLVFSLAACGESEEETETIELGYQSWVDGIVMTHLTAVILEDEMGYDTDTTQANLGPIFSDVASGNLDLMVHAWLPNTHASYEEDYGDEWEELGVSFEGAQIGLVVPEYVDIDSIDELNDHKDEFGGKIVGIESGSGIMDNTEKAIEDYDLELDLQSSSDPAMVSELEAAINDEEWVVVTGWTPHYKFAEYDLKFLEDPEGTYGGEETIESIGRPGFEEDYPEVAELLDNIHLNDEQFGELDGMVQEADDDANYKDLMREWMDDNEDVWQEWIPED
ncbi:MAG: glycine betaine ABC transporter substrate-binding protein [Bacillota bacterium]